MIPTHFGVRRTIFQLTIPTADLAVAERAGGPDPGPTVRMQHQLLDRLVAIPGVESAGFSSSNDGLPLDGDGRSASIFVEGRTPVSGAAALTEIQFVSPHFFETLRTPLIAGRTFDWNDVYQERRVVLVSQNLARAQWGSAHAALGMRIGGAPSPPWWEVVGVVTDVHHDGLSQPAPEVVIFPAVASETASFVIRSERVGTTAFLEDLQNAVWSLNANLALASVQTLGTMALLLGLVGIYSVVSYAISQRHREISIRLALGAGYGEVRWMFVRGALVLVGIGVAIGLGAAVGLTRLMESQLFGVSPLDPSVYLAGGLLLMAAAGAASYLSARRGSALNPVEVLQGG